MIGGWREILKNLLRMLGTAPTLPERRQTIIHGLCPKCRDMQAKRTTISKKA